MTNPPKLGSREANELVREVLAALDRLEGFVAHLQAVPNRSMLIDQTVKLRAECIRAFGDSERTVERPRKAAEPEPEA